MLNKKVLLMAMTAILVVVSSTLVQKLANVEIKDVVEERMVQIVGANDGSLSMTLNGSGEFKVVNKAYFTFKGKIVNLSVENDGVNFLVKRTGNGIWSFYYDNNSNTLLDGGDIKMGEVKIEQNSSSLDVDEFTVRNEKVLKITIRYEPYVETGNYSVKFEIVPVYEKYS